MVWIACLALAAVLVWVAVRPSGALYSLSDRVIAGPDGVRTGANGRRHHTWSQIARFEIVAGRDSRGPACVMFLHDGGRIRLRALCEVDDGLGTTVNRGAVEEDVRKLNLLLERARAGAA